jgi:6-pyruvoyl-tetrahydropterin synthase
MNNITFITVKHQFEGVHCYPDAPNEVAYLRNNHRHMFHVEVEIEVTELDRELEFIMVKNDLQKQFVRNLDHKSCEMIATEIQSYLKSKYGSHRKVNVRVLEDGENGAWVKEI